MKSKQVSFVTPYLKGFSQVMLQNNMWTGLLFSIGIFLASITMGFAAVVAVVTGTLTARFLKFDKDETNTGLYGFSASLVGIALVVFFKPVIVIWFAIIIGSVLATIIQHEFIVRKIPGYTFPFIITTWITLFIFHYFFPSFVAESANPEVLKSAFIIPLHGFSQVMFIENYITGILFFIAVFICSPIAALYGLFGSVAGACFAELFNIPADEIVKGLFSFNAVLCAITFAGNSKKDGIYVFISVILSELIQIVMQGLKLPVLTFPFVAASWLTLLIRNILRETF